MQKSLPAKREIHKKFGVRLGTIIQETYIPLSRIHNTVMPNIPAWTARIPEINLKL